MKSWKTSIMGLALVITGLYVFITTHDYTQPSICIASGLGLFFAADEKKSKA